MTTSGITAFSNTARDIAHIALRENGIIPLDEIMEAAELSAVFVRLNAMMKSWQAQGALWKQETISVNGAANTATIVLPAYVREVNAARYVNSPTSERMIYRWERDDYSNLPNKASIGAPTAFFVDRNAAAITLFLWPVPAANYTLKLDIDRAMDTVINGTETLDFPEEVTEAVYTNLAVRCCGIFGQQPAPELFQRAQLLERQMLDSWRPASYTLGYGC